MFVKNCELAPEVPKKSRNLGTVNKKAQHSSSNHRMWKSCTINRWLRHLCFLWFCLANGPETRSYASFFPLLNQKKNKLALLSLQIKHQSSHYLPSFLLNHLISEGIWARLYLINWTIISLIFKSTTKLISPLTNPACCLEKHCTAWCGSHQQL